MVRIRIARALGLAAAIATAGCSDGGTPGWIVASGHVEATDVRIATKIGGTVESLALDEGDPVRKGDAIARIEIVDLRLALDAVAADRKRADAELRLLVAGAREEEIAEAEALVAQALADLGAARKDFDRMQALLASGSGTEKARDDAMARRDVAAARLDAANERLRKLRTGSRKEEVDAARARLAAAGARIAQIDQQIRDASVRSPVSGIVTGKLVEQGEIVQAGTALLVVTDLEDAWLNVYVSEPDLGRIRLGQSAQIVTDDGQRREGRIKFVASEAEFTPKNVQTRDERVKLVFKVKIALDNRDGLFKPGMPAEARILPAEQSTR